MQMKLWARKIFVAIITVITLGMYIPPLDVNPDDDRAKDSENFYDKSFAADIRVAQEEKIEYIATVNPIEEHLQLLTEKAKEQTRVKLGPKIMNQVEDDLLETIFPKIEAVIEDIVEQTNEKSVPYVEITENPSNGTGERIFNVYDRHTNATLLKFHVRRDNRPLEGHWFNFHYHVQADQFEEHHQLGEIYWAKDDPPQWMA